MFSFCIIIVCLVKVKKTTAKTVYEQPCSTSDAKRSWSVKKTFARTDQTTWNRVKLRYFDVCVLLNFFMTTQLITNLTPSTPKALGHHPPTETTRFILTSTLLNMTYSPLNPDASVTTCRKLNAELYVYLNKDMTLLSSQPTKARRLWFGQKMVLRRMLLPTQQSYFLPTTGYWSYCTTETSYRIRQTNAQRWTYPHKKPNNTYYIRIPNPDTSLFSLKSINQLSR